MARLGLSDAAAAFLLLAIGAGPAAAQNTLLQNNLKAACASETRTLCPTHAGEPEQLKACLLAHRDRVSPVCSRVINAPG